MSQADTHRPLPTLHLAADVVADEWQKPAPQPIATGLAPLDCALDGGFLSGSLAVLIAATGRGKTGLVIQIARGWLAQGRPVLFIETEMSNRQTLARFLAPLLGKPWREVFAMGASEASTLSELTRTELPLLCVHRWRRGQALADIIAAFPQQAGGAPLVILDQLNDLARSKGMPDMRLATMTVTGELKELAEQQRTLILAVSQTARSVAAEPDRGRPKRHGRGFEGAAKDAGEVESDAATVLYLESEPVKRGGVGRAALHIAKNRGGPCNEVVELRFHGAIGTFEPLETQQQAQRDQAMLDALEELGGCAGIAKLRSRLRIGQAAAQERINALVDLGLVVRSHAGISLAAQGAER